MMSAFATWAGGFGLAMADQGPDKDPDGDKAPNLMEYIAGSNPSVADTSRFPVVDGFSGDLSKFQVIVHVRKDLAGINIGFDVATGLGSWSVGTFAQAAVVEDLGDVERVRFEITLPQNATQLFVRMTGVQAS